MKTAGALIDDIRERLAYVMATKETAVHQTLALTEDSLATLDNLKVVLQMQSHFEGADAASSPQDDVLMQVAQAIETVQQRLTEMLMLQSYQDLTAQVLQRVIQELQQVDPNSTLCETIDEQPETAGFGPAATAAEKASRAQNQHDVDDLLAQMGL